MNFKYKKAILGGTFDHFHLGHKKLVDTAFDQSEHVTVGLTKAVMYKDKFLAGSIEDYSVREENLKNYLQKKGFLDRSTFIAIADIYGTTLQDKNIEAIFATEENVHNVDLINIKRKEIGFPGLKIVTVAYVRSTDKENITSERIRKGEIDRDGLVYKNIFDRKKDLVLSDELRPILQKPIGEIAKSTNEVISIIGNNSIVIAVGDIISSELKKANFDPAITVIDFRTERHFFMPELLSTRLFRLPGSRVVNKPGTISKDAVDELKKALDKYLEMNKHQIIIIDGEEDLLALPAILLSPLGSIVLYGQFDMGVVVNTVTEELKERVRLILEKFE